ncbi:hypothetical protein [Alicyclobacillus acidocaldarius]|nr:hypothetical protein [Alicyclobacillus acidocaldarius]
MSKARNRRAKRVREGGLDPTISRGMWLRKPQTQVVPNKKAESRRAACRRWQGRGDFLPCNALLVGRDCLMVLELIAWYVVIGAVIVGSHYFHVAVAWRVLAGMGYLVLSYLWYLSLRRNDPSVSDPFGALMGAGYTAAVCLGLAFSVFVPIQVLVIGYMLWAWAASSYAGRFAFRKKGGQPT